MATAEEIAEFVREYIGYRGPITVNSSLQDDLRIYGDDIDDLLDQYAQRFGVDMSSYRWYFHTCEEGPNLGGLFFPPPPAYVTEIPITIGMLHEFAEKGRWGVQYPPHQYPKERYDLVVNKYVFIGAMVLSAIGIWFGCVAPR